MWLYTKRKKKERFKIKLFKGKSSYLTSLSPIPNPLQMKFAVWGVLGDSEGSELAHWVEA